IVLFFFSSRRRHTRSKRDWSSDVCSSDLAEKNDIPFQYSTMAGGGTDSGSIHLTHNGVPALSITIATRYIHSNAAVLHRDDFENAVKLIVEVIKNFDQKQLEDVRKA